MIWWGGVSLFILALLLVYYKCEKLLFIALAFSLPISFPMDIGNGVRVDLPSEIVIALLAVATIIRYLFFEIDFLKRLSKSDLIAKLSLAYIVWMSCTAIASQMTVVSVKAVVVQLSYILVFFVSFRDLIKEYRVGISRIYIYYALSLVFILVYALWNWIPYHFVSPAAILISKPFYSDHTILSTALVFLLPICIAYAYRFRQRYKIWFLFAVISFFIIILMLHARAAWLSLLMASFLIMMFHWGLTMKRFYILIALSFIGIFVFQSEIQNTIAINQSDSSSKHADLVEETQSVININNDVSNLERINRWSCAWRMFLDRPIFGFGPGSYQFQYIPYQRSSEMTRISVNSAYHKHRQGMGGSAHSEYFLRLSESGLPAFIIYFLLWFVSLSKGIYLIKKENDFGKQLFIYAIMLAISSYFIHSFFNNFLETGKIAFLFWTALAFLSIKEKETISS